MWPIQVSWVSLAHFMLDAPNTRTKTIFKKQSSKHVSCEFDKFRVDNSSLQAA